MIEAGRVLTKGTDTVYITEDMKPREVLQYVQDVFLDFYKNYPDVPYWSFVVSPDVTKDGQPANLIGWHYVIEGWDKNG